jgi:hypothetical protein
MGLGEDILGGSLKHLMSYVKLKKKNIMIKAGKSGSDLGLATGDPNVRTFDLGELFPSPSLSLSHIILLC